MACENARVENSELNFVKSSSEMDLHLASDVIFEKGGLEIIFDLPLGFPINNIMSLSGGGAVTMNGGVGRVVVNKGHVYGFI